MTETRTDTAADATPTPAVMTRMMAGFQISQALYVVAKLGVPTVLDEGSMTVAELAERTGAHHDSLYRLVRTLAAVGVFTTDEDKVRTTALGATLSQHHPGSVYNLICFWMETHYLPFSELLTTARTGQPAADRYLGQPFFDWSAADPERAALQSRAMADVTASLRTGMFDTYPLPAGDLIADIGGADGSVLIELLRHHPDRRGIVFDLPTVIPSAHTTLARTGLDDRVTVTAGNFFDAVPTADIYLLGYILHDWDDESSLRILHTIATAASPGARLLVIEGIVPADDSAHLTKMIDLTMLGMVTGKERTAQEYRELLDRAGFTIDDIVTTPSPFSIIEATLADRGK